MNKYLAFNGLRFGVWAVLAVTLWQLLPDQFMGPYSAWNPHAIMEFVITIFSISLIGQLIVYLLGARNGWMVMGLIGGFASSTATIHTLGVLAKSSPQLADRAALGGVLSNLATLVQLWLLLNLLAPQLLPLFIQPMCFGLVGLFAYVVCLLVFIKTRVSSNMSRYEAQSFDWKSLLTLVAVVCSVSYASAALNAIYGQGGLWLGAALSGLVDAHAIVPAVASLLTLDKLQPQDALMPVLIALSTNTITKSFIALQAGGWQYAMRISGGVWITAASVWVGVVVAAY
jgi:uncharacterized membrane protein (DUF4010 family)